MIILKWKLKMMKMGRRGLDSSGCGYRTVMGSCNHDKTNLWVPQDTGNLLIGSGISVLAVLGNQISSIACNVRDIPRQLVYIVHGVFCICSSPAKCEKASDAFALRGWRVLTVSLHSTFSHLCQKVEIWTGIQSKASYVLKLVTQNSWINNAVVYLPQSPEQVAPLVPTERQ